MKPTRGNSSSQWNSTFATTRRAIFQLPAWYRKLLYRTTGLWLGRPTGRWSSSGTAYSSVSLEEMRIAYSTPRASSAS